MTKHSIRCSVCNKFITFEDMADDSMCVPCSERINSFIDRSTAGYRRVTMILLGISIGLALLLIAVMADANELYDYKVYGQNKSTGLMVAGHLWEQDKEGTVLAKIWDEFEIQDQCLGAWVGYGVAQVGCENGVEYVLEVVEK
jgi:hypothetical protein